MTEPLILTLAFDPSSFEFFNRQRKEHFPPAINYLNAHLTLFHHLPAKEPEIIQTLEKLRHKKMLLKVVDVVSIGRGVAFKIESNELTSLHAALQKSWQQWLIPQDKQKLWPHVTVQNKVDAETAKQTQAVLKQFFKPFTAYGEGLSLFVYKGGPWEEKAFYPFI